MFLLEKLPKESPQGGDEQTGAGILLTKIQIYARDT